MKYPTSFRVLVSAVAGALLVTAASTGAQNLVFFEDWETDHSVDGTYRTNYTAGGVNFADLYFDYSLAGVPLSPHSSGVTTRALKMTANLDAAVQVFPSGVSISPVGFGITENFDMRFDMWCNFNGPLPAGGNGSTQVGGAGYGTAGTAAQVAGTADSVFVGATADGGSGSDYRVYGPGHQIGYQDGSFRIGSSGTDSMILGDPSSGYVYAGTNRNNSGSYYTSRFPAQTAPVSQFNLYPQQTNSNGTNPGGPGACAAGALAFKWHEVSLKKVGNVITYSIDEQLIATVDVIDAGTLGGTNILFNHYDITAGASTDPNRTNLIFTLIDNVRITNFANVVSATTATPTVAESGPSPTPGTFTVTRTSSGFPLTVAYTMSGTALNGVDYTTGTGGALSGTVTFAANATSTNIMVFPVDDQVPEATESITLSIDPNASYIGAGVVTINIVDNDPPLLTLTNVSKQMYERTNDYATFRVSRLGSTNTAAFTVNLSFSGTAVLGVDYYTNATVTLAPGVQSSNFNVYPIQDQSYEGQETVVVNLEPAGAGEYTVGTPHTASINLVDGDGPAETVLFSDNFNVDSSAAWRLLYGTTNAADADYTALFAFDYSGQNIPPAPHGSGDTLGLFVTVNKDATQAGVATAAALNLYPVGQNFTGNYALRFDLFLNMVPGASSTEYALFGLNHSGNKTNWWRSGGIPGGMFDGIFYAVETDAQSSPHYVNYSSPTTVSNNPTALTAGTNAAGFVDAFKSPPWIVGGSPAMSAPSNTQVWADVELSQLGNVLTLTINHTRIFSYTNGTPYTSGNVMIGYEDAFDSLGSIQNYAIYDNVRVVRLSGLRITPAVIVDLGANVQMDFTFDSYDTPAGFAVQAAQDVTGPFADVAATIVQVSPGTYRATVAKSGALQFYRIRRR